VTSKISIPLSAVNSTPRTRIFSPTIVISEFTYESGELPRSVTERDIAV